VSDPVDCDRCGTIGYRRLGAISPKGWFYAEVYDSAQETHYIYACSSTCCTLHWKQGPGRLNDMTETQDSPSDPSPAALTLTESERNVWRHTVNTRVDQGYSMTHAIEDADQYIKAMRERGAL
jgi:hypothetical protein